jgi:hypothetical protein
METSKKLRKKLFWRRIQMKITWMWRGILCFFGKFQKPREIIWLDSYGGKVPSCPRCHEMVYYENRCCFCGLPFKNGSQTVGSLLDRRADS